MPVVAEAVSELEQPHKAVLVLAVTVGWELPLELLGWQTGARVEGRAVTLLLVRALQPPVLLVL
jgi:hypothetical protein